MTIMPENLIGFDARENWMDSKKLWDSERRKLYLINEEVEKPLSTDILVWPSLFYNVYGESIPASRDAGSPLIWTDLVRLEEHLARFSNQLKNYWVIALTVADNADWDILASPIDAGWKQLGYDVSDASLLSGLMGAGYNNVTESWRDNWKEKLNQHHLFREFEDALDFAKLTNNRVVEHAPFFVYGIYLVSNSNP